MIARTRFPVVLALASCLAGPAVAQAGRDDPWIHISVHERQAGGSSVEINVPLSVAEPALALAPDSALAKGRVRLDAGDVSLAKIRRLWMELRETGDAPFVTARDSVSDVTVARAGNLLDVRVTEMGGDGETVRLRVPVALVDALFAGQEDHLDLVAAVKQLQTTRGEVLTVEGPDSHVRIWIDEQPSSGT
jgi:hypothetical protein